MLEQFANYLQSLGKSPNTIAAYCRDVSLYLKWCEGSFGEQPEPVRPQVDFEALRTILYGHHMGNGTMFNGLMDYKEQGFYDSHPTALLLAPAGDYEIEFFSGYVANVRADAWQVEFGSEDEFTEWLQAAKRNSLFQSSIEPSLADKVLTLSTCSYEFENARFVLHGVLNNLS